MGSNELVVIYELNAFEELLCLKNHSEPAMKVSLITRYFNYDNAGIGAVSTEHLGELLRRGWRSLDLHSTSSRGSVGYFLYTGFQLGYELKMGNSDVDVFHALTPMETLWTPEERTLVMFHDLIPWLHREIETWYFEGPLKPFRRMFGSLYFKLAAKKASRSKRIHCNSEATRNDVIKHLEVPENRITITRPGIGEHLKPVGKEGYDHYRIGTLSYLDPRKRIDLLVRAFKGADLDNKARLLIGGAGRDSEVRRLRRIAGNDERINFLGFVPEVEKAEFLSSLDVFVMPSILEGYGIPCVEAMACRTPVIILKDAMIPDDVKGRSHIVGAEELTRVLEGEKFDCDIEANLEFASMHRWRIFTDKVIALYEEIYESQ